MKKERKPIDMTKVKPEEMIKYEIAKELGLFDKVLNEGWGALSAKETGRIGGIITKRRKAGSGNETKGVVCVQSECREGENSGQVVGNS